MSLLRHWLRMERLKAVLVVLCIVVIVSMVAARQTSTTSKSYEPDTPEKIVHCGSNLEERRPLPATSDDVLPMLYLVTPTYRRPEQLPELIRLGQTLLTVPRLTWLVVEDADACSPSVAAVLHRLGMPYVHQASAMPEQFRKEFYVPRGVSNRRAAIKYLRALPHADGVLYFLDDDNAIDIRLLEQIRHTRNVSMFPVGLIGDFMVSSPIVKDGAVAGFFDSWPAGRTFAVDMAGFAVNLRVLRASAGTMPYHTGYEEDQLLRALGVSLADIELLADDCTQVLVWHTKTKKNKPVSLSHQVPKYPGTNIGTLVQHMQDFAMVTS